MRFATPFVLVCFILLAGCSGTATRPSKISAAGEKATVDSLTYSVVDSETLTRLGDEAAPRIPANRFVTVQIAVSNGGNGDVAIPGLTLIGDDGKSYPELADGSGLPQWLGVIRKVAPGQTERGTVLFDAPAAHYRLKLTDETNEGDVFIDIPLSFVHEQMRDSAAPAESPAPSVLTPPKTK